MNTLNEPKQKASEWKEAFRVAFPVTLPILPSMIALAMTYGVLMETKGFGFIWPILMSAIAFCGSMQFAAIPIMVNGFAPVQGFILSFLINSRHIFYGIPMLEKYKGAGKLRPFLIFALNDESFAISCSAELGQRISQKYFHFWVTFLTYISWLLGTILGSVMGSFISGNVEGLEFSMTALFLVMFLESLEKKENIKFGAIGLLCSIISLLIVGPTAYMIPAMILIVICLLGGHKQGWF